ncbi:MAG: hypothetical protein M3O34_10325 [Chloroflexota bacterium]|nr:hypothetical protein [Chloroflexota bacterium]
MPFDSPGLEGRFPRCRCCSSWSAYFSKHRGQGLPPGFEGFDRKSWETPAPAQAEPPHDDTTADTNTQ